MRKVSNLKNGNYSDGKYNVLPGKSIEVEDNEVSGHMREAAKAGFLSIEKVEQAAKPFEKKTNDK